jgi:hypothetical protein
MKKALMTAIVVFFLGTGAAFAAEEEKTEPVGTVTSQLLSAYVDDNGAKYVGSAASQSAACFNLFGGSWLEIWNSQSLRTSKGNEIDLTLGLTKEISEVEFEVGVSYVDLDTLLKVNRGDAWKGYVSAKKSFKAGEQTLTPFVKVHGYLPVKGNSADEKGINVMTGLEHSVPFAEKINFSHKAYVLYDDGAIGYDTAVIGSYEAGIEAKLVGSLALTLSTKVTTPLSAVNDGRKTEIVPAFGIKFDL